MIQIHIVIPLLLHGHRRIRLELKMLIIENTTFHPETLYSMRKACEPKLVSQPYNMIQLKFGKLFKLGYHGHFIDIYDI